MLPSIAAFAAPPEVPESPAAPAMAFEGPPLEAVVPMYPVIRRPRAGGEVFVALTGVTAVLAGALIANHRIGSTGLSACYRPVWDQC